MKVLEVLQGHHFEPAADLLSVKSIEAVANRASYGVTYRAGTSTTGKSGSGVVFKLKCKGKAAGSATFTIVPQKLEIRKPDGTLIDNFSIITKEDLTLVVQ